MGELFQILGAVSFVVGAPIIILLIAAWLPDVRKHTRDDLADAWGDLPAIPPAFHSTEVPDA